MTAQTVGYLLVAGGGGGGGVPTGCYAGGGGAGGLLTGSSSLCTSTTYSIVIGSGGAAGTPSGASGGSSTFNSLTAVGGGGGTHTSTGVSGGSGGGGSGNSATAGGAGTAGQGNNGGNGYSGGSGALAAGGGGGGAGAAGCAASASTGGNGGAGVSSSLSGASVTYAGGGGGGNGTSSSGSGGAGGSGGGGNGGRYCGGIVRCSTPGTPYTGGGGGGSGGPSVMTGKAGGSGIAIVSYAGTVPLWYGGAIGFVGGNIIHTFTSSGTLTPAPSLPVNNGTAATGTGSGGGGGASTCGTATGGAGTKGAVIVSYEAPQQFFGGTVSTVSGNIVHTFTCSGTLSPGVQITYLGVGGGGGGGYSIGGGGGGGQVATGSTLIKTSATYTVTIGAAGGGDNSGSGGGNGGNTSMSGCSLTTITAVGGGLGGGINRAGQNGASGGGGGGDPGQTLAGNATAGFSGGVGYVTPVVSASLRFRSSASANFGRTFSTPTSSQKFTWSGWVKRGKLDATGYQGIFSPYGSGTVYGYIDWAQNGIRLYDRLSGGTNYLLQTSAIYVDVAAWYHLVYSVDTTQSTSSNRVRLYVNGVEVTSFSTATYPTQNNSTTTNSAIVHNIGWDQANNGYFDGELYDVNFIDGQQLPASSFGQTDPTSGAWTPKTYSGSYGTNGYHLTFSNTTSPTTLGYDTSGNNNNWTPSGISTTAGSTYDAMTDTPQPISSTVANYAVMNPLDNFGGSLPTFQDSNLTLSFPNASVFAKGTMYSASGKYYFELSGTSAGGITNTTVQIGFSDAAGNNWKYSIWNGDINSTTGASAYDGTAYGSGAWPTIGIAVDTTSGKIWFRNDSGWYGSADPAAGTNPAYTNVSSSVVTYWEATGGGYSGTNWFNFGQQPFTYTPPTGFNRLNTYNL